MRISITCPTRSRQKSVLRFIRTAYDMAEDPDNVELLFGFDSDDPETKELLLAEKEKWPHIVLYEVPITRQDVIDGLNIHQRYFGPLAQLSTGRYVWGTGNDVEFCTPNYDQILERRIEDFLADKPDRVAYIAIDADNAAMRNKVPFCPFHVTTREVVEAISSTTVSEISSWGADSAIWNIFRQVAKGSRLLAVPEVSIKHWSYHTGRKHGEQEVDDGSGANGDSISYRLSTKVMHLTAKQHLWYVRQLEDKIRKYSSV